MIHSMADEKDVAVDNLTQESEEVTVGISVSDPKWGLSGLAETKKQDFPD